MKDDFIDNLIADHVMNWARHARNTIHWTEADRFISVEYPVCGIVDEWSPTSKVEHAWQVLERMKSRGFYVALGDLKTGIWYVRIKKREAFGEGEGGAYNQDPKRAICEAALQALGVKVGA